MQSKAVIHLRQHLPGSLARVARVYDGGNILVVQRKRPDVKLPDQGEHGNIERCPDSRNILVVELAEVLQRPQTNEVFVVLGKELLRNRGELGMLCGRLAHRVM